MDKRRALALLPFQHDLAKPYRDLLTEDEMAASWQLIQPDGTRLKKKPAVVALVGYIHATRWLAVLARRFKLAWLLAAGDLFFNLLRAHLGKIVPDRDPPVRWP